jgi:hypothetical protein
LAEAIGWKTVRPRTCCRAARMSDEYAPGSPPTSLKIRIAIRFACGATPTRLPPGS